MKFKETLKKFLPHTKWQLIICVIMFGVIYSVTILVNVVINSVQMLQSLIQAEATILGFFGIIAVYTLTSYDSRIDRFEQQRFELNLGGHTKIAEEINKKVAFIRKRKSDTAIGVAIVSGFIIFSLIFGITLLGINNSGNSGVVRDLSFGSLSCFFMGIVMIIFLFYQMSYEAQEL